MSGKKWKGKLLLLICLTAWLLFLLIQDRTHDAEEPPSGNGEELILPEPGVPEQEETLSKIPSADACIRVLILNKSGGIYHETKEPDRKYPGTMQDYETENGWVIVNEVPLEEYLRRVVPSEMPSGYAEEALKAQAVCARTYAVWQMQEYAYPEYEAHVDDRVSFQVYNQVESQESTDQAVQETKGQIMLYEGRPVKAYYFATSCGVTTDEAIWEDADPTKTPYIEGRRTGNGSLKKSLTEETVFERFIRKKHAGDLEIAEPWYRWNCYLSLAQPEGVVKRISPLIRFHADIKTIPLKQRFFKAEPDCCFLIEFPGKSFRIIPVLSCKSSHIRKHSICLIKKCDKPIFPHFIIPDRFIGNRSSQKSGSCRQYCSFR